MLVGHYDAFDAINDLSRSAVETNHFREHIVLICFEPHEVQEDLLGILHKIRFVESQYDTVLESLPHVHDRSDVNDLSFICK